MSKLIKTYTYNIILNLFKIRHLSLEIYNRWLLIKTIKKNIKNFIPRLIFNYFQEKKLKKLMKFPESFSIETVNICNAKCWFCPQQSILEKKDI